MKKKYSTVLTIAGSDSGGGAGIQADIKAISAMGCYAASAITAITVQNTMGVQAVHPVPLDLLAGQIDAVLSDIGADAVKIGGGYGNIARVVSSHLQKPDIEYEATVSEYPRFCEGSRYWLQWSGFDEEVYTPKENKDD